ncbi:PP2C family protein-serine/threonine phosphatase [Actinomadura decatromicini]|uniref:Serine/threonine-protein phosphatase n=1 Tax=Actinomadura decatromicini TaxID=2604572 RepID=A0A5D3F540_9ACTN|nr:PP2C family protein-serine/threonine phosphatase [Actinomadura decatromicini]TYK44117.1 serine/threonine-protein phosphatase [Actinomadura decatromicini]
MITSHRPAEVERAIRSAPAHSLPEALGKALTAHLPAVVGSQLFLADYHLNVLVPVNGPAADEALKVQGTAAGQAFVSRCPVIRQHVSAEGPACQLFAPVTARGERLGVLSVLTLAPDADRLIDDLVEIGELVGAALKVAWNHSDRYERARRRQRLTLAAEIQWQLLPGHGSTSKEFSLAGHLEPAYSIAGDNFDWSTEQDHLTLTVTNGSGTGIQAALLTALTVGALRNSRRSGEELADQAGLAGAVVNARYRGHEFTETILLRIDLASGLVSAVDAGSPHIFRMRGEQVIPIELEHQMPLGMFPDTEYKAQEFKLDPGDRLLIVSDGVYSAISPYGEDFGTKVLQQQIFNTRLQDPAEVPLSIITSLMDYHEGQELLDDAVVVCLDWK